MFDSWEVLVRTRTLTSQSHLCFAGFSLTIRTAMILRSLLFFTLTTGCIAAATITTQVNCDGVVYNALTCSDSQTGASVSIAVDAQYVDSIGMGISADGFADPFPPPFVGYSAEASFQDDYLFTVTGGSGSGMIRPCISAFSDNYRGLGDAGIGFGNAGLEGPGGQANSSDSCEGAYIDEIPFTFGIPQVVTVDMSASVQIEETPSETDDSAYLYGLQFFDDSGNQLSNVHFSLVSTTVPEPGMWFPLLVVLLLLFGWKHLGNRESAIRRYLW
jgi:hypothetical protein